MNSLSDVTCGIKTLMRPACLRRLLDSIHRHYPDMRCVVVDDSREPTLPESHPHLDKIKYVRLPFDTGLGPGRNAMIEAVETPFCVYLDDDFVFGPHVHLERLRHLLDAIPADIVGGQVQDRVGRVRKYHGTLSKEKSTLVYRRTRHDAGTSPFEGRELKYELVDIVLNFFMGRTDVLRRVGWDDELKINTHTKFFWDCKQDGDVRVAYTPNAQIMHRASRKGEYAKLRGRKHYKRMMEKIGVTKIDKRGSWS